MIISKLTSKAQTTIPQAVRMALHLSPGDEIAYVVEDGRAVITRRRPELRENPFASFTEWESDADEAAYASL